ncbi:MAG: class I SAM-dependent methyltransferase [Halobacteriota archaeon]
MHHSYHNEKERRKWQNPEAILAKAGVQAGDVFIDLGCGFGFFALPAAKIVGQEGLVCGIDIDSEALEQLRERASNAGLRNVHVKTAQAEEVSLCNRCADIAFIGIALHDFKDPLKVLKNAKTALKPNGRLVNVDWKKESMPIGPPLEIRFNEEEASSLLIRAGFTIESVTGVGEYHYLIIAH